MIGGRSAKTFLRPERGAKPRRPLRDEVGDEEAVSRVRVVRTSLSLSSETFFDFDSRPSGASDSVVSRARLLRPLEEVEELVEVWIRRTRGRLRRVAEAMRT